MLNTIVLGRGEYYLGRINMMGWGKLKWGKRKVRHKQNKTQLLGFKIKVKFLFPSSKGQRVGIPKGLGMEGKSFPQKI